MSTPALDRAAEESFRAGAENAARRIGLAEPIQWSSLSREDQEHVGIQARAAVSAALHDPDDPDFGPRNLYETEHAAWLRSEDAPNWQWEALGEAERGAYRKRYSNLVAAILGEA